MKVAQTDLPGCLVIEPRVFGDERGFFYEGWNRTRFAEHGIHATFVQSNVSQSARGVLRGLHYQWPNPQGKLVSVLEGEVYDVAVDVRRGSPHFGRWAEQGLDLDFVQSNVSCSERGVLRGLHYQWPNPQGKLVSVLEGEVYDVAVDIRRGSPTFGRWVGAMLTAENHRHFWIPEGFAHGFCVLSDFATFSYQCTALYDQQADAGIRWDDESIGIEWPICTPLLSEKDARAPLLGQVTAQRLPLYEREACSPRKVQLAKASA